jgi:hypothetical protein
VIHDVRKVRNNRDDACRGKFLTQHTMPGAVAGEAVRQNRNAIECIGPWLDDIHLHVLAIEVRRFGAHAEWRGLGNRGGSAQQECNQEWEAKHALGKWSGGGSDAV